MRKVSALFVVLAVGCSGNDDHRVGDIVLTEPQAAVFMDQGTLIGLPWPGGIVPYVIDPSLEAFHPARAHAAMAQWQERTGIVFRRRTTESSYVIFTRELVGNCRANLGMNPPGYQPQHVWVTDLCTSNMLVHELGHAVGLIHEQQRSDRDQSIDVFFGNIENDATIRAQFDVIQNTLNTTPYDYGSAMHYHSCQGSWDPTCRPEFGPHRSMLRKDGRPILENTTGLTYWDAQAVASRYGAKKQMLADGWPSGILAACRNTDGRLELFRRRPDGSVWQTWQTSPGGAWAPWVFTQGAGNGDVACAPNGDGRLEAFVRGADAALWHRWQTSPGGAWSGWQSMGGWHSEKFAVGRNADGRLEVFSRDVGWALQHASQGAGGWTPWQKIGSKMIWEPVVAGNKSGHLEVFARATEGDGVFHVWQQWPGGTWNDFQPLQAAHRISGGLAVARNADGRLEVFGRGFDGGLYAISQLTPGGLWNSNWVGLGGSLRDNAVAVNGNKNGTLEAFVIGAGGALYHKWQTAPGGTWSGYAGFAGAVNDPIVAQNADGRLEAFVRSDYANITCHRWQLTPAGAWSDYACWQQ